jgi:hypothetical protein
VFICVGKRAFTNARGENFCLYKKTVSNRIFEEKVKKIYGKEVQDVLCFNVTIANPSKDFKNHHCTIEKQRLIFLSIVVFSL